MKFVHSFTTKFNRIRKKNWSAPTIMAVFIFFCMVIIYSFESIGIAKKEKNLIYRSRAPEKTVMSFAEDVVEKEVFKKNWLEKQIKSPRLEKYHSQNREVQYKISINSAHILTSQLQSITKKDKEEYNQKMLSMLVQGMQDQIKYETLNETNPHDCHNQEQEFFE